MLQIEKKNYVLIWIKLNEGKKERMPRAVINTIRAFSYLILLFQEVRKYLQFYFYRTKYSGGGSSDSGGTYLISCLCPSTIGYVAQAKWPNLFMPHIEILIVIVIVILIVIAHIFAMKIKLFNIDNALMSVPGKWWVLKILSYLC